MSDQNTTHGQGPVAMTDDEALEFAEQVFDVARRGDAVMLDKLLEKGLPRICATIRAIPC